MNIKVSEISIAAKNVYVQPIGVHLSTLNINVCHTKFHLLTYSGL